MGIAWADLRYPWGMTPCVLAGREHASPVRVASGGLFFLSSLSLFLFLALSSFTKGLSVVHACGVASLLGQQAEAYSAASSTCGRSQALSPCLRLQIRDPCASLLTPVPWS